MRRTVPFGDVRDRPLFADDGCPRCARRVARRPDGRFYRHLDLDPPDRVWLPAEVCDASGRTWAQALGVQTVVVAGGVL